MKFYINYQQHEVGISFITKLWEGNVSIVSVCYFVYRGGFHVTIALDALDLMIQDPSPHANHYTGFCSPLVNPPLYRALAPPLSSEISWQDCKPVLTCSLVQSMLTFSAWLLKHIRSGSGRYAFYWNVFLLYLM